MFEVTVRKSFEASHTLRNYSQGQEKPHQHSWECAVTIAASALDPAGCAMDFVEVDQALAQVLAPLSQKALHETEIFRQKSPSAENIAHYIYRSLSETINDRGQRVTRVTVWEDPDHSASYTCDQKP
jgi:6-pyruvoyl-tetrahydropterin synthase